MLVGDSGAREAGTGPEASPPLADSGDAETVAVDATTDAVPSRPTDAQADARDGGNRWPGVVCNGNPCDSDELCCLLDFPGYPDLPDPDDFSCRTSSSNCEFSLECDGDHDCASGEACCATENDGDWDARCEPTCGSSDFRIGCTLPEHCSGGQQCCAIWGTFTQRFLRTVCDDSCGSAPNRVVCTSDADCGQSTPNCTESTSLPGYTVCLP
jgi:hypothetical protein